MSKPVDHSRLTAAKAVLTGRLPERVVEKEVVKTITLRSGKHRKRRLQRGTW